QPGEAATPAGSTASWRLRPTATATVASGGTPTSLEGPAYSSYRPWDPRFGRRAIFSGSAGKRSHATRWQGLPVENTWVSARARDLLTSGGAPDDGWRIDRRAGALTPKRNGEGSGY